MDHDIQHKNIREDLAILRRVVIRLADSLFEISGKIDEMGDKQGLLVVRQDSQGFALSSLDRRVVVRAHEVSEELKAVDEEAERHKLWVEGLTTANRRLEGRIKTLAAAFAKQVDMVDAHGERLDRLESPLTDADGNLV